MTTGISTSARLSVSSRVRPLERTVSRTSLPAGPLIRVVASSELVPAIERPLTFVITSPGRRPPRWAGEPSYTVSTCRPRLTFSTLIPTPSKRPSVASWKSSKSRGAK